MWPSKFRTAGAEIYMANLEKIVEKEVSLENDENYKKLLEEIKEAIVSH